MDPLSRYLYDAPIMSRTRFGRIGHCGRKTAMAEEKR